MDSENIPNHGSACEKSIRLLRPSIVVLCGPAACGKSTFAKRHFRPTQIISSDWARALICDDERDQRFNAQAFALVHFLVQQRLTVNRLCVVDSTALTAQTRKELLDLAKKCQVPTTLMLLDVPLETCVERDEKRERSVGRAIVERQYQAFEQTKATIRQEGFDQVELLQDGDLERVQVEILFRPVVRPPLRAQQPEGVTPRQFERSAKPSMPRPSGPGDNGRKVSTAAAQPVAQRVARPQPTTSSAPGSRNVTTPRPIESPAPVANTQPPPTEHPPAAPAIANKPNVPPQAAASPKPAASVAPRPLPVGVESSGRS